MKNPEPLDSALLAKVWWIVDTTSMLQESFDVSRNLFKVKNLSGSFPSFRNLDDSIALSAFGFHRIGVYPAVPGPLSCG
ncbi:hypothetical protein [Noviherbaspirillum denitrificans]|uniref:hypothetical protein n=1 Tax=Noviherbaspirillum denitrificans TaxID=1968433 RepID=UPI001F1A222B|nr:hypothetical protein [Noviherbaspirillum denitrificans]